MPLGSFEREVLRTVAANRNPDSFIGGATVLLQSPNSPRSSQDVDIFLDAVESLQQAIKIAIAALIYRPTGLSQSFFAGF
jgi:hypothetical protein